MGNGYGYEIEFLPVGEGEKCGDAIVVRFGTADRRRILVVDGGTTDSGKALVDHINQYYGNPGHIHGVVCTHPDDDHSSGLREVIKAFSIGAVYVHRPWLYAEQLLSRFKGNWTVAGLRKRLKDDFPIIAEISDHAEENGIPVYEPFQGTVIAGEWIVLSPSFDTYLDLVPHFSRTPEPIAPTKYEVAGPFGGLLKALKEVTKWVRETWSTETLKEDDTPTSPSNESSVVLFGDLQGDYCLLTGDAGIRALTEACDFAEARGLPLRQFSFSQVPHHGSRHNVSPSLLDRLVGPKVGEGQKIGHTAFVSAAQKSSTHPRRVVTNAYTRRGVSVNNTKGNTIRHHRNMPGRGWQKLAPLELFAEVEGD